jgi:hypothetical protein
MIKTASDRLVCALPPRFAGLGLCRVKPLSGSPKLSACRADGILQTAGTLCGMPQIYCKYWLTILKTYHNLIKYGEYYEDIAFYGTILDNVKYSWTNIWRIRRRKISHGRDIL